MVVTVLTFVWMFMEIFITNSYLDAEVRKHHEEFNQELEVLKPFYPNFLDFFVTIPGLYEGIPIVPALYSNARRHRIVGCIMQVILGIIAVVTIIIAPFAVMAYGTNLKEIVLLNMDYGSFQQFL